MVKTRPVSSAKKKGESRGRKPVVTDEVVRKLEEGLRVGLKVKQACYLAGIGKTVYYEKLKNKEFADRMDYAKSFLFIMSRQLVAKAIIENKSLPDAWKYLEKRDPDFKTQSGVTINNKNVVKSEIEVKESTEATLKRLMVKYGKQINPIIKK